MIWACVLAFSFGVAYAWTAVLYYGAVNKRHPWRAAGYDVLIGVLAVAPLQVWWLAGGAPIVLAAEVLGSAVGTFAALKLGR